MVNIKRYKEINNFLEATGFYKKTDISDFFILKFEEITSSSVYHMPPYQKDFYQIGFIIKTNNGTKIEIDTHKNEQLQNSLFFVSPDHIYSWTRSEHVTGYILYFKRDYLNFYQGDLKKDFTFFDIADKNSFHLKDTTATTLTDDFEKLYKEYHTKTLYRYQIIQSSLLALLFKIKSLEEITLDNTSTLTTKEMLVFKFQNLVKNCFRRDKQVKNYADKLHVSSSHLNEVLKEVKGKTAKELIIEKTLSEAKKELSYTTLSIAEVAYNMGFEEPTHFTRFFKKYLHKTPKQYREHNT
ncbi:hypothetical protein WH52_05845 [Tenacibaculum holothuriorum]|uniref:HTH araC/xylS-type domain-containing protein n=1 Tax=Tenacibaculum holothuriorum TaxID=1635173 RepID=A0A1Y2PCT2_9FLAO|nr:helix-turn-helix domain-containing protein [Tenacibaculum holothuriorum]OSY88294.1 hypothetical protein WH52_05845 [Tenacibaculum holothuriorum]